MIVRRLCQIYWTAGPDAILARTMRVRIPFRRVSAHSRVFLGVPRCSRTEPFRFDPSSRLLLVPESAHNRWATARLRVTTARACRCALAGQRAHRRKRRKRCRGKRCWIGCRGGTSLCGSSLRPPGPWSRRLPPLRLRVLLPGVRRRPRFPTLGDVLDVLACQPENGVGQPMSRVFWPIGPDTRRAVRVRVG